MAPEMTDITTATDTANSYDEDDTSMELSAANNSANSQPPDVLPQWAAMMMQTGSSKKENADDEDMELAAEAGKTIALGL